jgi:hypothetical protein
MANDNGSANDNGINIHIGELIIKEFKPNQFKYNDIHITSIYKYDLTNMRFYTTSLTLIQEQIGDYAFNKLKPYVLLDQI